MVDVLRPFGPNRLLFNVLIAHLATLQMFIFVLHAVIFALDDKELLRSQWLVAVVACVTIRVKVNAFDQ